jgi:hypothetical protein
MATDKRLHRSLLIVLVSCLLMGVLAELVQAVEVPLPKKE